VAEVAALTGAAVVVATAALGGLVSGAAGPGRLADVGPDWRAVGPLAGAEVAAVAAAVLLLLRHR
jgi:hypothetical protein